ncbi:hypothetical protein COLO4_25194 [Corchorus olitorius]|uniref:Uncharacterized protein n=1 Tax=Corchorus olitorius TaxID=93759 RepID=A0A1R3I4B5_9ROSI|nr:hypothetical protein COLO4_25194 [Corchorus olitorius]
MDGKPNEANDKGKGKAEKASSPDQTDLNDLPSFSSQTPQDNSQQQALRIPYGKFP